ncbi:MAG: hypothetical protein ABI220_00405 [Candidatus Saccharimonadales bacterium]
MSDAEILFDNREPIYTILFRPEELTLPMTMSKITRDGIYEVHVDAPTFEPDHTGLPYCRGIE